MGTADARKPHMEVQISYDFLIFCWMMLDEQVVVLKFTDGFNQSFLSTRSVPSDPSGWRFSMVLGGSMIYEKLPLLGMKYDEVL